jgi:hypothetical protein
MTCGTTKNKLYVLIVISEAVGVRIKMRMFDDPQYAMRWIRREVDGGAAA